MYEIFTWIWLKRIKRGTGHQYTIYCEWTKEKRGHAESSHSLQPSCPFTWSFKSPISATKGFFFVFLIKSDAKQYLVCFDEKYPTKLIDTKIWNPFAILDWTRFIVILFHATSNDNVFSYSNFIWFFLPRESFRPSFLYSRWPPTRYEWLALLI